MSNFILTQYFIALLLTGIVHLSLALLVILKGVNKRLNQTYALYSISIAFWSIFEALGITRFDESLALLLWRINHIGVIFIPIFFVHFVFTLLSAKGGKRKLIPLSYMIAFTFLTLNATPLFILEVVPKFSFRYFINPGYIYYVFFFLWVGWAVYGLVELFREYFRTSGYRRNQIKYFCWSMLIAYIGGAPNFFPTFNIEIPILMPFGTYAICIYAFFTAYAIIKYRLMDITIAIKKTTILAVGVLLPVAGVFIAINLFQPKLQALMGQSWWLVPSGVSVFLTLGLFRFVGYVVKLKDEEISRARFHYRKELREHTERLAKSKSIRELVNYTVRHISTIAGLDFCAIALRKREDVIEDEIIKKVDYYLIEAVADRTGRHMGSLKGKRIEENSTLITYLKGTLNFLEKGYLQHLSGGSLTQENRKKFLEIIQQMEGFGSELIFPSLSAEHLVGLLFLGRKLDGSIYSKEDLELFSLLANQAAKPISEIIGREENIRLILASCHSTLAALQERDHYTRGHTERVKEFSLKLAEEEEIKRQLDKIPDGAWGLEMASELHDLGKIGIPDNILNKPGRLNAEEFNEIKKHPQKALVIIGEISAWLKEDIISGILQHQEHYDGTGYPNGLKDDQIHLYARIIHVADALDAMTSARPYRPVGLSMSQAIEEIKKNSGQQFDPLVAGVAVKLHRKGLLSQLVEEKGI